MTCSTQKVLLCLTYFTAFFPLPAQSQGYVTGIRASYSALCFIDTLRLNVPVRYTHVQLLDSDGRNLTKSAGSLNVVVHGSPEGECRFRKQVVDRFDGTYIVRLRLWTQCDVLSLTIVSPAGDTLCGSPITLESHQLFPEQCNCPTRSLDDWLQNTCSSVPNNPLLESDLSHWPRVDFAQTLRRAKQEWGAESNRFSAALCHYRIVDNEVYRTCYGEYTGFRMFADEVLTSLARKMRLPNTEYVMNLGDYPLEFRPPSTGGVPIVSWCGSNDTYDVVLPTYELMQSVVQSMDRVTLDVHTALGTQHTAWKGRFPSAVFRGRDSNQLRIDVAKLAQTMPELVSGGITRYFFHDSSDNPTTVEQTSFSDFFKHRYVISIDGTVAAYRFPFLLAGDSVVLKATSKHYEHFYGLLQPHVHYVPFRDTSSLRSRLENLGDKESLKIIHSMKQFVRDHLQPLNALCYYGSFLKEYTGRLMNPPVSPSGMEHVVKDSASSHCDCSRTAAKDEL